MRPLVVTFLFFYVAISFAGEKIRIAASSDLQFAMTELTSEFKKTNPNVEPEIINGASGKFFEQIQNGAPFDLFFSADKDFPKKLKESGKGDQVSSYAIGRIALWSTKFEPKNLSNLADAKYVKIAIANPAHAPYGKRAEEALQKDGVYAKIKDRLVLGENVSQTAQFVETGAADAGIVAFSHISSPKMKGKGHFVLISDKLHSKLEQAFIVLTKAPGAQAFAAYIKTKGAKEILKRYGFEIP